MLSTSGPLQEVAYSHRCRIAPCGFMCRRYRAALEARAIALEAWAIARAVSRLCVDDVRRPVGRQECAAAPRRMITATVGSSRRPLAVHFCNDPLRRRRSSAMADSSYGGGVRMARRPACEAQLQERVPAVVTAHGLRVVRPEADTHGVPVALRTFRRSLHWCYSQVVQ